MLEKNNFDLLIDLAKHELGHWFAAKKYSFNADYIKIYIRHHYSGKIYPHGYTQSNPQPDLPEISDVYTYLTGRIVALQCGVVAEFMEEHDGKINCKTIELALKSSAENDQKQILELINIAKGIRNSGNINFDTKQKQFQEIYTECWEDAVKLVMEQYEVIQFMSRKMAEKLHVSSHGNKFTREDLESLQAMYCPISSG